MKIEGLVDTIICPIENADKEIVDFFKSSYRISDINPDVETKLNEYLDLLKDGLFLYVEYPYVDKVYRNSYYTYFSSKHQEYERDCLRVSIFQGEIDYPFFRDKKGSPVQSDFHRYSLSPGNPANFGGGADEVFLLWQFHEEQPF